MLTEVNQMQKDKYYMSPLIWGAYNSQIHQKQEVEQWLPRRWEKGEMSYCLMGSELHSWAMKKFWKWTVVMVT